MTSLLPKAEGNLSLFACDREPAAAAAHFEALAPGRLPGDSRWAWAAQPRGRAALRVEPRARGRLRRLLHLRPRWNRPRLGIPVRLRRHAPGMARARVGLSGPTPLPPATRLVRRPVRRTAVSDRGCALERAAGRVAARDLRADRPHVEPAGPSWGPGICRGAALRRPRLAARAGGDRRCSRALQLLAPI